MHVEILWSIYLHIAETVNPNTCNLLCRRWMDAASKTLATYWEVSLETFLGGVLDWGTAGVNRITWKLIDILTGKELEDDYVYLPEEEPCDMQTVELDSQQFITLMGLVYYNEN